MYFQCIECIEVLKKVCVSHFIGNAILLKNSSSLWSVTTTILVQVFFFASSWPWTVLEKTQKDWNSIRAPIFRQIVEKLFPSSNVAKLNWKAYLYNIGTFLVLYNFWKLSKGQNCFRQNTHQKMRNILTSNTNEKKSCQMQQSIQSVF